MNITAPKARSRVRAIEVIHSVQCSVRGEGELGLKFDSRYNCYFSFQPVLYDWCNKGRGMCYPVLWVEAYKIILAANRKES